MAVWAHSLDLPWPTLEEGGGGGRGLGKFVYQKWSDQISPTVNSIAYRQGTSKREEPQSVNQSVSHEVIQEPPTPVQTPKQGGKHIKRV